MREHALAGEAMNTGWAEWSVENETNPRDKEAWYETNPSLGYHLTERKILDEIGDDELDFNIQRLGYWIKYNLKSAISKAEWEELKVNKLPKFKTKLYAGIKYGKDGNNVSLSIGAKTSDNRTFVEAIDCRSIREGNGWIVDFLKRAPIERIAIDGNNGQQILADEIKKAKLRIPVVLPTVKEIIVAGTTFENAIYAQTMCHMNQPSLTQSVTNSAKRAIGSNGGFGYKSIKDGVDITLLESTMLANWLATESKEKTIQRIRY